MLVQLSAKVCIPIEPTGLLLLIVPDISVATKKRSSRHSCFKLFLRITYASTNGLLVSEYTDMTLSTSWNCFYLNWMKSILTSRHILFLFTKMAGGWTFLHSNVHLWLHITSGHMLSTWCNITSFTAFGPVQMKEYVFHIQFIRTPTHLLTHAISHLDNHVAAAQCCC